MSALLRLCPPLTPQQDQDTLVRVVNVHRSFTVGDHKANALTGVFLKILRGEFVALRGRSGSGKTTLLNILGCLDRPSSGDVFISGVAVGAMDDASRSRHRAEQIGFIFQTFNLLPVLNAFENIEYPLLRQNLSRKVRRDLVTEALELVGLTSFANHRPDELSGGQRQRVAIARAIIHKPPLLIADEPTANLDQKTAGEILNLIVELNRLRNIAIVVATHDPMVVSRAHRVVQISDGGLR